VNERALSDEELAAEARIGEHVLRELGTQTAAFQEAIGERLRISVNDHRCLELLDRYSEQGPETAGKLAELTGLTTGAITGVLDRLERAGFVRREKSAEDRRQVQIKLVAERDEEVSRLFESVGVAIAALCGEHSASELAAVWEFMRRLSAIYQSEARLLRAGDDDAHTATPGAEELSEPLARHKLGRFEIARGATNLTLESCAGEQLYRAHYAGPPPRVRTEGGHIVLQYKQGAFGLFSARKYALQIALNEAIPWELVLRGGASKVAANLKELKLKSFELRGGASHVTLELPPPSRTVPVRVSGGSSHLKLVRPRHTPVRVQVTGGVSHLSIDKLELGAVGGTARWESPDYEASKDRFEIQISGGASQLSIEQA
jgi:DNA-binding MarR family transcriptional regulator